MNFEYNRTQFKRRVVVNENLTIRIMTKGNSQSDKTLNSSTVILKSKNNHYKVFGIIKS